MHVHAESVQGCAIRVRGSVWHPLYVHYCTSDRYLLAPVSLSRAERILRSTGSAHALVHTLASRWTPSRLTLVRSPLSVLLARLGYRRTHEKENEISFPLFPLSSSSSFFFFYFYLFYTFACICVGADREKLNDGAVEPGTKVAGFISATKFCHFEVSEIAREPCTHTRLVSTRFVFDSVIRIRIG